MSSLALTLLYLLAAVLGVVACRSLRLPPMMGYLAAGILIGPHALALTQNSEGVRHLGEFGVVFLMFSIGLEFSLPKLRAMRKQVFENDIEHWASRFLDHLGSITGHDG